MMTLMLHLWDLICPKHTLTKSYTVSTLEKVKILEPFHFHENRGTDILLHDDCTKAQKGVTRIYGNGIAVSREPMYPDTLFEVRVTLASTRTARINVGVLCANPSDVSFPCYAGSLQNAVIIYHNGVMAFGKWIDSSCGRLLWNPSNDKTIGVMVDAAGSLHLFVNSEYQGRVAEGIRLPCHALFHIGGGIEEITALPLSTIL